MRPVRRFPKGETGTGEALPPWKNVLGKPSGRRGYLICIGRVVVLAVVAAVAIRPLFLSLTSLDLQTGFSTTVAKSPTPPREK